MTFILRSVPAGLAIGFISLFIAGCSAPGAPRCYGGSTASEYFCHSGYNFGKNRSQLFKEGVRDGCQTAKGFFARDYAAARSSSDYLAGWDAGRRTCRFVPPKDPDLYVPTPPPGL